MIQITLNGEAHELEKSITVLELLQQLKLEKKKLALEVNKKIVPRSQFEICRLKQGDAVEIVQAIGGG